MSEEESSATVLRAKAWAPARYQIPKGLRCSRSFLTEANHARYIVAMEAFLFRGKGSMPVLANASFMNAAITLSRAKLLKKAWGLSCMTRKVMIPLDVSLFQAGGYRAKDLQLWGPYVQRTKLVDPWREFPSLPTIVEKAPPVLGMALPFLPVAQYFAALVEASGEDVNGCYSEVFKVEYWTCLVAAPGAEKYHHGGEGVVSNETLEFLTRFRTFPPLQVVVKPTPGYTVAFTDVIAWAEAALDVPGENLFEVEEVASAYAEGYAMRDVKSGVYTSGGDLSRARGYVGGLRRQQRANRPPRARSVAERPRPDPHVSAIQFKMTEAELRCMSGKVAAAIDGQPNPAGQTVRKWMEVMAEAYFSQAA